MKHYNAFPQQLELLIQPIRRVVTDVDQTTFEEFQKTLYIEIVQALQTTRLEDINREQREKEANEEELTADEIVEPSEPILSEFETNVRKLVYEKLFDFMQDCVKEYNSKEERRYDEAMDAYQAEIQEIEDNPDSAELDYDGIVYPESPSPPNLLETEEDIANEFGDVKNLDNLIRHFRGNEGLGWLIYQLLEDLDFFDSIVRNLNYEKIPFFPRSIVEHFNEVIHNRFEFLLYLQIVHHISTNKLTLQNSIKYKRIDDDLMPNSKWKKNKPAILKKLDYPKLQLPIQETLKSKQDELTKLYKTVNAAILGGKNEDIIITHKQNGKQQWRLRPLESTTDPNESLLASFRQCSIVDAMRFVNDKTKFMKSFDAILPKSKKGEKDRKNTRDTKNTKSAKNELDIVSIMAVTLANAIRVGAGKMSKISDLNASALSTAESAYIRVETLIAATDTINNAAAKLPIYKQWYINSILHGSLDGLKLETSLRNILARHSSKFFGCGVGVSAYNEIVNCFSIAGRLIGTHDYEGNFTFEMVHHQNTSEIRPKRVSTDKHGMNVLNFGLFDFTDMIYAPRIPKPHRETLWGLVKQKITKDS